MTFCDEDEFLTRLLLLADAFDEAIRVPLESSRAVADKQAQKVGSPERRTNERTKEEQRS